MELKGKKIDIFKAENHNAPLVILNSYMRSGGEVYKKCKETGCPDFTLVEVSGLNWEDDMSPWAIPPISEDDIPCGGKADDYLCLLLDEIIPSALKELDGTPEYIAIAGYSFNLVPYNGIYQLFIQFFYNNQNFEFVFHIFQNE